MDTEVGEFGVKIYNVQWAKEVGGNIEMEEECETCAKTPKAVVIHMIVFVFCCGFVVSTNIWRSMVEYKKGKTTTATLDTVPWQGCDTDYFLSRKVFFQVESNGNSGS